jgi:hypothetical protein
VKDLFGAEVSDAMPTKARSPFQAWKARYHYRDCTIMGESCRTCVALVKNVTHSRTYHKCREMGVSSSEATDIRLHSVCDLWRWREK